MSNTMLYNLERPKLFAEVGGNKEITELLRLLIKNGEWKNAHFIFSGTPGTGKTTTGRILARAINCTSPEDGEPCNKCKNCTDHLSESYGDYIEIDATQYSKVEDAKRLVDLANQYPINPKGQRVILLDEAHVLSNAAFDKFLKLLESANVRTTFIFCTTDLHLFRPAIVSRCFGFQIKPLNAKELSKELTKICKKIDIKYSSHAINKLAHHYVGKPRDAVKVLDLHLKAHGCFLEYQATTQESIILNAFKLAFYNKPEEYLPLVETLDAGNIFRNVCRALNDVFLYPHANTDLIPIDQIEEFKNLIDNQNLKTIIKDVIQFKPDDLYSLTLMLATVSEMGLRLTTKAEKQMEHRGRRFRSRSNGPDSNIVSLSQGSSPQAVDIDSDELESVSEDEFNQAIGVKEKPQEAVSLDDLVKFGFKEQ